MQESKIKHTRRRFDKAPPSSKPTPRQVTILKMISDGLTSKEIGKMLGISVKTVESHRTDLMRRTGCPTLAHLVRYAVRHRIIEA